MAASPIIRTPLAVGQAKNLLINGMRLIDQRSFGAGTPAIGVYGQDRWRGHANGLEQVIEYTQGLGGSVTLSWLGGGNGSIDGGVLTPSPVTATVAAGGTFNCTVPNGASQIQCEHGTVATLMEYRTPWEEIESCQRYYETFIRLTMRTRSTTQLVAYAEYKTAKRVVPTVAYTPTNVVVAVDVTEITAWQGIATDTIAGAGKYIDNLTADAEY